VTSLAQLRANRLNALRSSGPRTAAGKAAASRNATKHGLCVPVAADREWGPKIKPLADHLAGPSPAVDQLTRAEALAEAHVERMRVRAAIATVWDAARPSADAAAEVVKVLAGLDRYLTRADARCRRAGRALARMAEPGAVLQNAWHREALIAARVSEPPGAAPPARRGRARDVAAAADRPRVHHRGPGRGRPSRSPVAKDRRIPHRQRGTKEPPQAAPNTMSAGHGSLLADALLLSLAWAGEALDPMGHHGPCPNSRFRRRRGQTNRERAKLSPEERLQLGRVTYFEVISLTTPRLTMKLLTKLMEIEVKQDLAEPPRPAPDFTFSADLSYEELQRRYNEAIKWVPPPGG
jgi:hypothetical protein